MRTLRGEETNRLLDALFDIKNDPVVLPLPDIKRFASLPKAKVDIEACFQVEGHQLTEQNRSLRLTHPGAELAPEKIQAEKTGKMLSHASHSTCNLINYFAEQYFSSQPE
jgi:hypothetical protein